MLCNTVIIKNCYYIHRLGEYHTAISLMVCVSMLGRGRILIQTLGLGTAQQADGQGLRGFESGWKKSFKSQSTVAWHQNSRCQHESTDLHLSPGFTGALWLQGPLQLLLLGNLHIHETGSKHIIKKPENGNHEAK